MKRRPKLPLSEEKPSASAEGGDAILQVKIWLTGISPMVWRRVPVPTTFTLCELHGVIQVVMGWEGRWCTFRTEGEVTPAREPLCDDALATNGDRVLPQASDSEPRRRWLPRSVGRRSRVLAAEVRSVPCIGPSSFRPVSVGHNLLLSARPTVLAW